MANSYSSINLVKKNIPFSDRFIAWALTAGRFLVVATELIALAAFIYRFSLDRQLIDLHSQIKQKQSIVDHFKKEEDIYRDLQERIILSSNFSKLENSTITAFKEITDFTPKDITVNSFGLAQKQVSINATAYSTTSLSTFINTLKNYKKVQSVNIGSIENKTTAGYIIVSINVILK